MDAFACDARFALRTLLRRPAVALLASATLALGIGASTAMFSVVRSVLLRPLPYPDPENLYSVYPAWPELAGHPTLGFLAERGTWSWPEYFTVAEQQSVFASLAAYQQVSMTMSGEGRPERVSMAEATWPLFPMLGVTPLLGRLFDARDGTGDSERVVLLTAGYWRDRFGADRVIVGRSLELNAQPYTVVGILPDGFSLAGVDAQMWRPRVGSPTDPGLGNHGGTRAIGRLAAGVSQEAARAQIERILQEALPPDHGAHGASVFPRQSEETRTARPVLIVMLLASGLLLAVACGNVATLLIGAGVDRERELALRAAVGAGRARLVGQLLTESTFLSLAGAAGGVLVAGFAIRALVHLAPPGVPRLEDASLDPFVLLFATGLAFACGVAFGSIPALTMSRPDLTGAMGSGRTTGNRRTRLQAFVVSAELGLATMLLVAGLLLVRTVTALNAVDVGFDHERLVVASIATPYQRFSSETDERRAQVDGYAGRMIDELSALPGVRSVATSSAPPLFGWRGNNGVIPEGWAAGDDAPIAERRLVSAGAFGTLGMSIVAGRGFEATDEDEGSPPVVVVSEGLAELAWPGEPAVGKLLDYGWGFQATVVGVAANVRDEEIQSVTELAYYAPQRQTSALDGAFLIRTEGDPAAMIPVLRDRIWSVDPDVPITRMAAMEDLMAEDVANQRYRARLMAVFAVLAALFATTGIYGVTSRSVARRTQEMGLRVALGADRSSVHTLVTAQAVRIAIWGVLVGVAGSVVSARAIESFLWGVSATDPWSLIAVGIALVLVAVLAAFPPAWRAMRVDPLVALRSE